MTAPGFESLDRYNHKFLQILFHKWLNVLNTSLQEIKPPENYECLNNFLID